jgi:hypothetical protein
VKFTAQSSRDTSMNVFFRKSGAPYTTLSNDGAANVVKVTTGRKEYEFVYVPQESESNTVLFLEVNARSQSFWLDNLKVHEADAELTNPDDSIKLVYNASASSRTIALSGTFVDPLGQSYSNSIALAPYTSAVLIKTSDAQAPAPVNQAPVVTLTSPTANATYTAPASVQLTATASDADGSVTKVEFYRGSTLILTEYTAPYDKTWTNVLAGTYTITAKAYDNSGKVTTSAPVTITVKAASMALASIEGNEVMMSAPTSSSAGFRVYPNPAEDKIFVAFDAAMSNHESANLTIRNTAGSLVKSMPVTLSGNGIEVDITALTPGTYVLTITGSSFNKSQKFLKAK